MKEKTLKEMFPEKIARIDPLVTLLRGIRFRSAEHRSNVTLAIINYAATKADEAVKKQSEFSNFQRDRINCQLRDARIECDLLRDSIRKLVVDTGETIIRACAQGAPVNAEAVTGGNYGKRN